MNDSEGFFKLRISLPYPKHFTRGRVFYMDEESSEVYGVEKGMMNTYPIRSGLAGYLWMLRLDGERYLKQIDGSEIKEGKK